MKQLATVRDQFLMKGSIVGWIGIGKGYLFLYGLIICLAVPVLLLESAIKSFGWLPNLIIYGTISLGLLIHAGMVLCVFRRTPYKTFAPQQLLDLMFITQLPIVGPYLWIKKYEAAFLIQPKMPMQVQRPTSLLEWIGVVLIVAVPLIIYFLD